MSDEVGMKSSKATPKIDHLVALCFLGTFICRCHHPDY